MPFTIEMWIKPDFSEMQRRIEFDGINPDKERRLWLIWLARKFEATLDPNRPVHGGFLMAVGPSSQPEKRKCAGSFYMGANKAGFVQTGLFSGDRLESWRPGWLHVLQSCTRENYVPVPDEPLLIGESFKGEIAEIRIWNKAAMIEDRLLYGHTSLTGNEPNLVACWDFKRADGQIVYDIGPNANHGRLDKWAQVDAADPNWVDL